MINSESGLALVTDKNVLKEKLQKVEILLENIDSNGFENKKQEILEESSKFEDLKSLREKAEKAFQYYEEVNDSTLVDSSTWLPLFQEVYSMEDEIIANSGDVDFIKLDEKRKLLLRYRSDITERQAELVLTGLSSRGRGSRSGFRPE